MFRNSIKKLSRALLVGVCLCGMMMGTPAAFAAGNGSDATVANGKKSSKDFAEIKKANFEACAAARLDKTDSQPAADSKATMCHAYKGHTDVFATFFDTKNNRMVLGTLGDAFESEDYNDTRYDTNRLIFEVGSKNIMQLSKDENNSVIKEIYATTREGVVWFFDQSGAGDTGALWPGLDTRPLYKGAGSTKVNPTVKLSLTGIEAPHNGEVFMYTRSGDDYEKMLGSAENWPKDVDITETGGKHEHMYWSFNRPGVYKLKMKATATVGDEEQSSEQTYTFHVTNHDVTAGDFADYDGASFDGDEDGEDDEEDSDDDSQSEDHSINVQQSNGSFFINGNNNTVYVTPWPGAKMQQQGLAGNNNGGLFSGIHNVKDGKQNSQNQQSSATKFKDIKGDKLVIDHGHVDIAVYTGDSNNVDMAVQEDVTGSHVFRDPDTVVFAVGEAGKTKGVYRIPQTQIDGVPWMGWNNQSMNPHKPTQLSLTGVEGPGNVRVWMFGGLGGGDQEIFSTQGATDYTIPANTHAHANWDFDEPGYYTLQFQASDGNSTVTRNIHVAVGVDPQETPMGSAVGGGNPGKKDDKVKNGGPSTPQNPVKPTTNLPRSVGNHGSRGIGAVGGGNPFVGGRDFGSNNSHSGKQLPRKAKKHKGLVSKISNKRLAKSLYRQKLNDNDDVVKSEAKGAKGLFSRNPVLAYSLIIGGVLTVLSVTAGGIWFLYKRGLISLNWLLRY
ncbi:choice-of-anchor M domain-containing protein [Gardnerella sp. DNF00753]|uniref:choice-of-anchor M domain-containing protein n=1 Tax=unclassified Gardnerella TaxID=2628112 RepID=UPI003BAD0158